MDDLLGLFWQARLAIVRMCVLIVVHRTHMSTASGNIQDDWTILLMDDKHHLVELPSVFFPICKY